MVLAYITCKDEKEAKKISMRLIKKHLIACSNILPIRSVYSWKGKICDDNETLMIAKTKASNFKKLEQEVKNIHSYEIPCILRIEESSNESFRKWALDFMG